MAPTNLALLMSAFLATAHGFSAVLGMRSLAVVAAPRSQRPVMVNEPSFAADGILIFGAYCSSVIITFRPTIHPATRAQQSFLPYAPSSLLHYLLTLCLHHSFFPYLRGNRLPPQALASSSCKTLRRSSQRNHASRLTTSTLALEPKRRTSMMSCTLRWRSFSAAMACPTPILALALRRPTARCQRRSPERMSRRYEDGIPTAAANAAERGCAACVPAWLPAHRV